MGKEKAKDFIARTMTYDFKGLNPDRVYEDYYTLVYPYLAIIGEFSSREEAISESQLRKALGVGARYWKAFKDLFEDFRDMLNTRESFMSLKTEIDLAKGIMATEHKNPKMIEMSAKYYNKRFREMNKVSEDIQHPKVIIEFSDASMTEEELDKEFDGVKTE